MKVQMHVHIKTYKLKGMGVGLTQERAVRRVAPTERRVVGGKGQGKQVGGRGERNRENRCVGGGQGDRE